MHKYTPTPLAALITMMISLAPTASSSAAARVAPLRSAAARPKTHAARMRAPTSDCRVAAAAASADGGPIDVGAKPTTTTTTTTTATATTTTTTSSSPPPPPLPPPLPAPNAERLLADRLEAGWRLLPDASGRLQLKRRFRTRNFAKGMELLRRAGEVAEAEGHHPDLALEGWNNVTLTLWTHERGGVTERDFEVAAALDAVGKDDLLSKKPPLPLP